MTAHIQQLSIEIDNHIRATQSAWCASPCTSFRKLIVIGLMRNLASVEQTHALAN